MVTHAQFKDLEPKYPSTMSRTIIQELLRKKIGFDGLVTTDCMEMKAITNSFGPGESAVNAAIAGANIILFSHTREYQEAAYDALLEATKTGRLPMRQINCSLQRITEMKSTYPMCPKPPITVIRSPAHIEIMREAARRGIVLLREEPGVIPVNSMDQIGLVEFASHLDKERLSKETPTTFAKILRERLPNLTATWLDPVEPTEEQIQDMKSVIEIAETIIFATRNAHLNSKQRNIVESLLNHSGILICLRNPYDAGVLHAGTTLLTLGDSIPSLHAAADALIGSYKPSGKLQVPLTME
jgi:beta-N-acetylhexosaminidase